MVTKKTKSKRREMSGERRIALALVEVIETYHTEANGGTPSKSLNDAIAQADAVLEAQGFAGLESISSRVAKINEQLTAAIKGFDGKEVQRLGRELERA